MKKASHRILNVWEERNVFDELFINELRLTLGECVPSSMCICRGWMVPSSMCVRRG